MTFVIADACIDVRDESCIEVCPVDCILVEEDDPHHAAVLIELVTHHGSILHPL